MVAEKQQHFPLKQRYETALSLSVFLQENSVL